MSAAFRTTIGWGMPWLEFENLTTMDCEAHATLEEMHLAFQTADPSIFAIDDEVYDRALYGTETPRAIYCTHNSLHSNPLIHEGDTFILGRPDELYEVIYLSEEDEGKNHVVFYPDCYHARRWKRHDDEIDLALLHYWEKGNTRDYVPDGSARIQYVEFGHGVWKTALMTEDGKPAEWMWYGELRKRKDLVPRVPLEMRWYLTRLGILDDAGVNKLRPLTAKWIG
ncbi:hypothetical protein O9X98_15220 [Agrobacterium salinitolerans]|nr:hypothetical protein [Agrobacterium salinitolerans]